MVVTLVIYVFIVGGLVVITATKGLEAALPFFVFAVVFLPEEAQIAIPGAFAANPQRVAVASLALLYLLFKPARKTGVSLNSTPLKVLLIMHIFWCFVSTWNSVVPMDSAKKILYEVFAYYMVYWIFVKTITHLKTIHRIVGATVLAVLVACIFGLIEAYSRWRVIDIFPHVTGRFAAFLGFLTDKTPYSTFGGAWLFGAAISCAIVEALWLLTVAKGASRKVYLWIALLIMFGVIYKLEKRGPWLALIIGLALFVLMGDWATRRRIAALGLLSVAVMVMRPGVYDTIKSLYLETVDPNVATNDDVKAKSFEYRFALRRIAQKELDKSAGRELWGYGMESFFYLGLTGPFYGDPNMQFRSCDSSWIELMVETGYVGLLIISLLLIKPALLLFRDFCRLTKPHNYVCAVLLINLSQYYFMMMNVAIYGWGQTGYMLWIWIAVGMVYKNVLKMEKIVGADEIHTVHARAFEHAAVPSF